MKLNDIFLIFGRITIGGTTANGSKCGAIFFHADTSTPIIAHIEDADGKADFYTAIEANKQVNITVGESGSYTDTIIKVAKILDVPVEVVCR